jgi:excisionase family DNA binding protein
MTQDSSLVDISTGLMTTKEAATYLRISTSSLYMRIQRNQIPFIRLGHHLRFRKSELDRALKTMATKTQQECTPAPGKAS